MERDGHSLSSFSLTDRIWDPLVSMLKQASARFWLGTQLSHPWLGHRGSLAATHVRINRSECEKHEGNKATTGTTSNSLAQHDPYQKKTCNGHHCEPPFLIFLYLFSPAFFFLPLSVLRLQRQATEHERLMCVWRNTRANPNIFDVYTHLWEAGLQTKLQYQVIFISATYRNKQFSHKYGLQTTWTWINVILQWLQMWLIQSEFSFWTICIMSLYIHIVWMKMWNIWIMTN